MKRQLVVYLVSLAAFLGPFTQTIYTPILPEVRAAFATSSFLINLTISIFTFFLAMMQIIYGPLTDRKGRRTVLLFGLSIYVAASLGCFFSTSITALLLCRAWQAVGIAAGSVVAATVIGDLFVGKERGKAMGTFQMMVSLGPVVGPIVGGFLAEHVPFRAVFLALVAAGGLVGIGNFLLLKETKPETAASAPFRLADFVSVFRHRAGSSIVLLGFMQYYSLYNFLVFLPGILTDRYGLSAQEKGTVYLAMSSMIVIGSFLGGRLQGRFPERRIILTTAYLTTASIFFFLLTAWQSLELLVVAIAMFGLFLGLSLPVQTTVLTNVFQANRSTAIGVYNFFRYMGMAFGPMIGSALLAIGGDRLVYAVDDVLFLACALFLTARIARIAKRPSSA